ncbi:MAG: hypothetical protein AB1427_01685 [Thermodesulfobacteriota bacterium]
MFVDAPKGHFRIAIAFLLLLCLSPTATPTQWLYGGNNPEASPETVLFIPRSASSAASVFAFGTRNRINAFDDLTRAALIPGQMSIFFARKSSSYLLNPDAVVSSLADRAAILIRAPPRNLGSQS